MPEPVCIPNPSHHNKANPLDVNGDGSISPMDALLVLNLRNKVGTFKQALVGTKPSTNRVDTNNDGCLDEADVQGIIAKLNAPRVRL